MFWSVELYNPETEELLDRANDLENSKEAFSWLEERLIFYKLPKISKQRFNLLSSKVDEKGTYSKSNQEFRKWIKINKIYKEPKPKESKKKSKLDPILEQSEEEE